MLLRPCTLGSSAEPLLLSFSSSSSSPNLSSIRRIPKALIPISPLPEGFPTLAPIRRALPSRHALLRCSARRIEDAAPSIRETAEEVREADARVVEGEAAGRDGAGGAGLSVAVGSPKLPLCLSMYRMSLGDQAFFLLAFIASTTSIAFTSLVIATIPTLFAMKRAATSLARLADTAREEIPSTMAAIRLSGMEISDLTLELSDLSQEIADGVSKSAQAMQAAEAGIRQIGASARQQTMSMIQERANLPNISLQPVVAGAARKTSHVVGQAKKTFMNIISRGNEYSSEGEDMSSKAEF
ncbi:uncharacterized protein LOC103716140 [Phoenix dactylifera]|uniref:Uncharacterized protein LOC103716140 n=1 Tax=Phoenix dactylifera TaxID=42345 RepID=A0A8B7CMJ6_PHODC|nr:uncharacterized protein LOC103716140 [Phoenix dactylifera]